MTEERISQFIGSRDMTVVDAMAQIDKNASGVLFIADDRRRLVGCLTDGDIRRWLIRTGDLKAAVECAMTASPVSIGEAETGRARDILRRKKITALPVVGAQGELLDIIRRADFEKSGEETKKSSLADVPVVVMAGGKGTRLYPYTKILPKPLIPIGDTPIVERVMKGYADYGIHRFFLTVNYKKEMIRSYFSEGDFSYDITYVEETKPLGTGGSLKLIEQRFDRPLFVTNCDTLILTDYHEVYDFHIKNNNWITMVAAVKNITIPYGVVHTRENGELVSMEEKPKISYMINTGMYVINPQVIEDIPDDCLFHMTHLVDKVRASGQKVGVYPVSEDSFLDMGEFGEMHRMEEKLRVSEE